MNKDRKAQIAEWAAKGAEWCATQLHTAREKCKNATDMKLQYRDEMYRERARADASAFIEEANNNLKKVLEENGIRPTKLRVYYRIPDCEHCPDCGDEWACAYCDNEDIEVVRPVSWYTYHIANGDIDGIVSDFSTESHCCYKIVNERTEEVLYEESEDE